LSGFLSLTVVSPSDHKSLSKFITSASDASIRRNCQHVNTCRVHLNNLLSPYLTKR
jgi:hypothetical protein